MDEKINVELWKISRHNVGFSAVEINRVLEVTTQLVYDCVTYYRAKIAEPGELIVVVVQRVNETLDFLWRWRSVANDLYQGQLVQVK
jgi:hypothetical protein